jgi:hypothetical protein
MFVLYYVSQLHLFAERLILYVQCITILCTETYKVWENSILLRYGHTSYISTTNPIHTIL